jgi:hypothetical protein
MHGYLPTIRNLSGDGFEEIPDQKGKRSGTREGNHPLIRQKTKFKEFGLDMVSLRARIIVYPSLYVKGH